MKTGLTWRWTGGREAGFLSLASAARGPAQLRRWAFARRDEGSDGVTAANLWLAIHLCQFDGAMANCFNLASLDPLSFDSHDGEIPYLPSTASEDRSEGTGVRPGISKSSGERQEWRRVEAEKETG